MVVASFAIGPWRLARHSEELWGRLSALRCVYACVYVPAVIATQLLFFALGVRFFLVAIPGDPLNPFPRDFTGAYCTVQVLELRGCKHRRSRSSSHVT